MKTYKILFLCFAAAISAVACKNVTTDITFETGDKDLAFEAE